MSGRILLPFSWKHKARRISDFGPQCVKRAHALTRYKQQKKSAAYKTLSYAAVFQ
jgi:hypothetical protein